MSDDIGEAVGAILGIAFGGAIMYRIGRELNNPEPVNLTAMGIILMVLAVTAAILLIYGLTKKATR